MSFPGPVAVTGATGYVAGPIVRELLARGAVVHATARDPSDTSKVGHLLRLAEGLPGTLKLFRADLLDGNSFAEAFAGCAVVLHTASPFTFDTGTDPQKTLVEPALQGTRNALAAASATPTVERVVLTSSVMSMHGDPADGLALGRPFDERDWNTSSSLEHGPYAYSKTVAEREAWKLAEGQRWRLVTLNPGFVMGPSLTPRNDSQSIDFLLALIDGRRASGIWEFWTPWVDVRDVALAHVEAAIRPDAEGRHALVSECGGIWQVISWLREDFGDRVKLPRFRVPKALAYVVAPPLGYGWRYVRRNVEVPIAYDATRSRERLGLAYRPLRETIREHVEQLIRDGLYRPA